jgi:hypothetical protein
MTQKHWALRFEASGNKVAGVAACAEG